MHGCAVMMIPEVSKAIMDFLLPSLLTLTLELELPEVSDQMTEPIMSGRMMDREHIVSTTARHLQDKLRSLPVLFCRMIRPHVIAMDKVYCFAVHILQIDAMRCRRIGSASKAWMQIVLLHAAGEGWVRAQSIPATALDHNFSCTLHVEEDHADATTDVTIVDLLHIQIFCCPLLHPLPLNM